MGSVVAVKSAESVLVVTFDDGPHERWTKDVLDALDSNGVTATFFVLLSRVRRHPEILADLVACGHEVALHGLDHRALPEFNFRTILQRTKDAKAELEDHVGQVVRWVRPPYGRQTVTSWHAVRRAGLVPVMWSASVWDSRHVEQGDRLAAAARASAGDILLAHDGFADASDGADDGSSPDFDRRALVDSVLKEYQQRGLQPCSLSQALSDGTAVRAFWFKR